MTRVFPTSGERVPATKRRKMTQARRLNIWLRNDGVCGICGRQIPYGPDLEIEHPIALAHGGADSDDRLMPVHAACHKPKTKVDAGVTGWIKRVHARIDGTRRPRQAIQSRGFPKGSRKIPSRPFDKRP